MNISQHHKQHIYCLRFVDFYDKLSDRAEENLNELGIIVQTVHRIRLTNKMTKNRIISIFSFLVSRSKTNGNYHPNHVHVASTMKVSIRVSSVLFCLLIPFNYWIFISTKNTFPIRNVVIICIVSVDVQLLTENCNLSNLSIGSNNNSYDNYSKNWLLLEGIQCARVASGCDCRQICKTTSLFPWKMVFSVFVLEAIRLSLVFERVHV